MIRSILDPHEHYYADPGDHYINTYQEVIDEKTGKLKLQLSGKSNVYELIQQDVESCKIENILHAAAMGDLNAMKQRDIVYADATTMPKNLMEAQNMVIQMKDEFYNMPIEVRREFDDSPERYVSLMGTDEFNEIMKPYNDKVQAIAAEKNHKEYLKKVKEGAQLNIDIEKEMAAMKGGTVSE